MTWCMKVSPVSISILEQPPNWMPPKVGWPPKRFSILHTIYIDVRSQYSSRVFAHLWLFTEPYCFFSVFYCLLYGSILSAKTVTANSKMRWWYFCDVKVTCSTVIFPYNLQNMLVITTYAFPTICCCLCLCLYIRWS